MNPDKELTPEEKYLTTRYECMTYNLPANFRTEEVMTILKEYGQQEREDQKKKDDLIIHTAYNSGYETGKKKANEWISIKQSPEFDGDYLCFIVRKNECGTFSKYQRVLSLTMNRWVAADNERVIAYKKLSGEPDRTVFLLDLFDSPAPPQQGKEETV